ncbi:MAG: hypothetical protein K8T25_06990 [Planctomycetia bacterium]|nr:hypothetical protein [Planctomycetia bacterium]
MLNHTIQVSRGSSEEIEAEIRVYEEICQVNPATYVLKLYAGLSGSHYVVIEPRFPGYHFNFLTCWLDSPPGNSSVGDACGWWASESECWYLKPNRTGDTATIVQPSGRTLTCYIPGNWIYPSPDVAEPYVAAPDELGELLAEIRILVANLEEDNNPRNEITDASEEDFRATLRAFNRETIAMSNRMIAITLVTCGVIGLVVYGAIRWLW